MRRKRLCDIQNPKEIGIERLVPRRLKVRKGGGEGEGG